MHRMTQLSARLQHNAFSKSSRSNTHSHTHRPLPEERMLRKWLMLRSEAFERPSVHTRDRTTVRVWNTSRIKKRMIFSHLLWGGFSEQVKTSLLIVFCGEILIRCHPPTPRLSFSRFLCTVSLAFSPSCKSDDFKMHVTGHLKIL